MADHYLMAMAIDDETLDPFGVKQERLVVIIPVTGTMTRAFVKGDMVDNGGSGFVTLRLRKNAGVVTSFTVPAGTDQMGVQSGLSVAVVKGDQLTLRLSSDGTVDETLGLVVKIET